MKGTVLASLAAAAGLVVGSGAGVMAMSVFDEPRPTGESAEMPVTAPPSGPPMDDLDRTIADFASTVKNRPGVHGVGRGYAGPAGDTIVVFVESEQVGAGLPAEVGGYPVVTEVVEGGFHAQ